MFVILVIPQRISIISKDSRSFHLSLIIINDHGGLNLDFFLAIVLLLLAFLEQCFK